MSPACNAGWHFPMKGLKMGKNWEKLFFEFLWNPICSQLGFALSTLSFSEVKYFVNIECNTHIATRSGGGAEVVVVVYSTPCGKMFGT